MRSIQRSNIPGPNRPGALDKLKKKTIDSCNILRFANYKLFRLLFRSSQPVWVFISAIEGRTCLVQITNPSASLLLLSAEVSRAQNDIGYN